MKTIRIEPGRTVVCDLCNDDFTDSTESGGALLGSYAVCPRCVPKIYQSGEGDFISARCPAGKSFADWVREDLR